jgi:hypothetical protein
MSNTNKMDTSAVFEMFETVKEKLDKQAEKQVESAEPVKVATTALDAATARIENAVETPFDNRRLARECRRECGPNLRRHISTPDPCMILEMALFIE